MRFYKNVETPFVVSIGKGMGYTEITESEYSNMLSVINAKPVAPDGCGYKLRADTLTWELYELPPVPEDDEEATAEDYEAALAEVGV